MEGLTFFTDIISQSDSINKENPNLYDVIVFHYPCQDGLVSAWVCHYYYKTLLNSISPYRYENHKIDFYPYQHNDELDLERLVGKRVLFCDITPKIEVLEKIESIVSKINILDHHHYIEDLAKTKPYIKFDNSKSGASLTCEHFFPTIDVPEFIKMVEDRDIWRWSIPNSKQFTTWLMAEADILGDFDENKFEELFRSLNLLLIDPSLMYVYIDKGAFLMAINNSKIKNICCDVPIKNVNFKGKDYKICIVNSLDNVSEIGNELCKKYDIDFAIVFNYNNQKNIWKSSLRSIGDFDTSIISRHFGGNGHKNASGFTSNVCPIELF